MITSDIPLLVKGITPAVRDAVAKAIEERDAVTSARIAALEAEIVRLKAIEPVPGPPGKDGRDGVDGKDGADGRDGTNGTPGERGAPGEGGPAGETGPMGPSGPKGDPGERGADGAKGADGRDGTDGAQGAKGDQGDTGRDGVGLAGAVIDRDGGLVVTLTDGSTKALGLVVGAKGEPGRDGRDGFGFDDLDVEYDGERTVTVKFVQGERVKAFPIVLPVVLDRGVYAAGKSYEPGDAVTWGGSLFIAQKATTAKPGEMGDASRAWRLAVKRGGEGKVGPQGPVGPQGGRGEQGPPGRGY